MTQRKKKPNFLKSVFATNPFLAGLGATVFGGFLLWGLTAKLPDFLATRRNHVVSAPAKPISPPVVVKVKSSLEELRPPTVSPPPSFVKRAFSNLPKNFRGTVTYKEGLIGSSGNSSSKMLRVYELTVSSGPVFVPDRHLYPHDSIKARVITQKFNHANHLREHGHPKAAVTQLLFLITSDPSDAEAHNNYGGLLYDKGLYTQAEEEWRQALRLDPTNSVYNANYFRAAFKTGLAAAPINILGSTRDGETKDPEGNFVIDDLAHGPLYNVTVRDTLIGCHLSAAFLSRSQHVGVFPLLPPKIAAFYMSGLGDLISVYPDQLPELDLEVTRSDSSDRPQQPITFAFVSRRDAAGVWHWYPKV